MPLLYNALDRFWTKYPGLYYALILASGVAGIKYFLCIGIPLALSSLQRVVFGLLMGLLALLFMTHEYHLPLEPVQGEGLFVISSLKHKRTGFTEKWTYKGTLKSFGEYKNIPVSINLPGKVTRPPADCDYWLKGTVHPFNGFYIFKINSEVPWEPVHNTYSLAELRLKAKRWVSGYIHHNISNKRSADFLTGLATGEFDDRQTSEDFGRFGLLHLMAISGFHFTVISGILAGLFSFALSRSRTAFCLMLAMTSYYVFLGPTASVMRAWLSLMIFLFGQFLSRSPSGLNSLGIGLLICLTYDPLMLSQVGFQFSFLITAAILLFAPVTLHYMSNFWEQRTLEKAHEMSILDKVGYICLMQLKGAIGLGLSVSIIAIPYSLYIFQKFPIPSLIYNLFFPFLVSISMLLLILGSIIPGLHTVNSILTERILDLTRFSSIEWWIETPPIPTEWILLVLIILFLIGILIRENLQKWRTLLQWKNSTYIVEL